MPSYGRSDRRFKVLPRGASEGFFRWMDLMDSIDWMASIDGSEFRSIAESDEWWIRKVNWRRFCGERPPMRFRLNFLPWEALGVEWPPFLGYTW